MCNTPGVSSHEYLALGIERTVALYTKSLSNGTYRLARVDITQVGWPPFWTTVSFFKPRFMSFPPAFSDVFNPVPWGKALHRRLAHLKRKSLKAAKLGLGSVEHNGSASSAAAAANAIKTRGLDLFIVIMFCVLSENATEHTSRKHVKRTKYKYHMYKTNSCESRRFCRTHL